MKINKLFHWLYGILMLLPFIAIISSILVTAFNSNIVITGNYNTEDIFYYAIQQVEQSTLFNWASNSFLVAPFAYISTIFNMPSNSVIIMLLSYWLSISIIWLCFDLIMYVPLLVHRWLDKGILE